MLFLHSPAIPLKDVIIENIIHLIKKQMPAVHRNETQMLFLENFTFVTYLSS